MQSSLTTSVNIVRNSYGVHCSNSNPDSEIRGKARTERDHGHFEILGKLDSVLYLSLCSKQLRGLRFGTVQRDMSNFVSYLTRSCTNLKTLVTIYKVLSRYQNTARIKSYRILREN